MLSDRLMRKYQFMVLEVLKEDFNRQLIKNTLGCPDVSDSDLVLIIHGALSRVVDLD